MADNSSQRPPPGTWPTGSFQRNYMQPPTPREEQTVSSGQVHNEESWTRESLEAVQHEPRPFSQEQAHSSSNVLKAQAHRQSLTSVQSSAEHTVVPSRQDSDDLHHVPKDTKSLEAHDAYLVEPRSATSSQKKLETDELSEDRTYGPIGTISTKDSSQARLPELHSKDSAPPTRDGIFRSLSRRWTNASVDTAETPQEQEEINRLMSRMFGRARQENSEDERTRHVGVIFRDLVVKGMGLGAALQTTLGDPFLGPFRKIRGGKSKVPVRTILEGFTGAIKPGEMLLVLGRPGAGCSTFLKVLANQRFGYEEIVGEVTYGGATAEEMAKNYRGEILYNPEDDLHYATLSVKNTLKFALKSRTPGKASRNEGETRSQYVNEFLRVVTKLFWIEHTLSTKVGNEFVRGVSGGEKKRVSIAEAMITKASTQCWDNSTRGLDANTALEYVQSLRSLTNMAHISTAVALYQAGESLYNLFDKVVLIDGGRCIYYGPTEKAAAYFEDLGFERPLRWTTADFLTSVTDIHERKIRAGWEHRIPRSASQFADAYRNSNVYQSTLEDTQNLVAINEEQTQRRGEAMTGATKQKNYSLPFYKQVLACTHRQFLVMVGDKQSLWGKWGGIVFQALIVGSLFFQMPQTSAGVFTRGGVLFFILLFNALLALAELTSAFNSRPILLKHKSFSFYRPAAYAIAQTVVDAPLVLVQVVLFDVIIYFMSGLARTASQFLISLLVLWITTMNIYAFFRAIGAMVGSLDIATRITGVAIQALIVYTGYLIPSTKMKPWFSWLQWINPVQYGFEALMANEFYDLNIQCEPPFLVPQGPNARPEYQSCLIQGSIPGSTSVSGSNYIEVAYDYSRAHLWRNIGIIAGMFIFFVALTMLGMELQKPNAGGGAVTIFKRGQSPKAIEKIIEKGDGANDEEKARVTGDEKEILDLKGASSSDADEPADDDRQVSRSVVKSDTVYTWQNVNYTIPTADGEKMLLQDVQGFVRPGRLTALMGASGAGKTTLLNTLAQRISFGTVSGSFLVDGRPLPLSFQRATGFAEQMDVHEPTATVREALRFSALLRQPKEVPKAEKYEYCEKIIDLLEMRAIAGATIGKVGEGLNQEQRKRLTIAVELASKPELLMFLDEPTSGLDSGAAFNVIRLLRKLADVGQAILCTIHQPSSVLFEHFDELILLKSGGRVVYHGDLGKDSRQLIDYFERNGGEKCPRDANPAEYMLEAIGAGNPDYRGQDWGDVWANSPEKKARTNDIEQIVEERRSLTSDDKVNDMREYAMPLSTQTIAVVKRAFTNYWRSPDYIIGKLILHIFTGLFNSFTFFYIGTSSVDMQSRLFSVFMTLTIAPPLIQQLQPKYLQFRSLFIARERSSKIYSWFAFTTGAVVVELPYAVLSGTIYMMCWWWGSVGRGRDSFQSGYTWMLLMLFEFWFVSFGQAIASFSPNELLASLLVPVFFLFVVSFCGIVVPYQALPYFWRSWMYRISPFTYLLEGFLGVAVHDVPVTCEPREVARFSAPPGQTCDSYAGPYTRQAGGYVQTAADGLCEFCQYANGDEFAASFNVHWENRWEDYGYFAAFVLFNYAVVYFCSWLYLGGGRSLKNRLTRRNVVKKTASRGDERA